MTASSLAISSAKQFSSYLMPYALCPPDCPWKSSQLYVDGYLNSARGTTMSQNAICCPVARATSPCEYTIILLNAAKE